MKSVAIVTDSTSDIPSELLEAYPIHQVPTIIVIGGKEYQDGQDLSRPEFYTRLPTMEVPPTTAAPSSGSFEALYRSLLDQGHGRILSIHLASALSGVYNAARLGAEPFGDRVRVYDSGQVSMGLGFQVLIAAEVAASGAPLDEIVGQMEAARQRIRVVAMLDTLEYLRRSGRVSWARASVGSLLRIKPFIGLQDGIVTSLGRSSTRNKGITRLVEMIQELGPLERLALLHTHAEDDAQRIASRLQGDLIGQVLFVYVTTVIGAHVGPGGLGFVAVLR